ncbi:hypothetical protein NDU88_004588 [Pleurodeles waltl]|uniref:Uncharacterized protein n=1 Tax=Pleurodeles waltl TaxID=8319 RepID=A0AAV7T8X3_PLEWA|nr:hypothetical protein NDU88_004588 [Pleurodeles waltl]
MRALGYLPVTVRLTRKPCRWFPATPRGGMWRQGLIKAKPGICGGKRKQRMDSEIRRARARGTRPADILEHRAPGGGRR